jgi:hypothetical protein
MESLIVDAAAEHYGFMSPGVTTVVAAVSDVTGAAVSGLPQARFTLLAMIESTGESSSIPMLAPIPFNLINTFVKGTYILRVKPGGLHLLRDGDIMVLIVTRKGKDTNKKTKDKAGKGGQKVIARGQAVTTIHRRELDDFDPK